MPGLSAAAKPTFLFWQWRIRFLVELLINLAPTWKTAEVAVVPGIAFGLSPCFRVSYAAADDVLADAMMRIAKVTADLSHA